MALICSTAFILNILEFILFLIFYFRYDALDDTVELLPHICTYLEEVIDDPGSTGTARGEAMNMMKSIQSFDFLSGLVISGLIMASTSGLCLKLQGIYNVLHM